MKRGAGRKGLRESPDGERVERVLVGEGTCLCMCAEVRSHFAISKGSGDLETWALF